MTGISEFNSYAYYRNGSVINKVIPIDPTSTFYELKEITRADIGLPAEIPLPLEIKYNYDPTL